MTTPTQTTQIQPYLFFNGRCKEAIEFYKRAINAEVGMLLQFKDSPEKPDPSCAPVNPENVMHAEVRIGASSVLMSDGCGEGPKGFEGFSLSLTVSNETEANKKFTALADGGKIELPLTKTFFSPCFGMLEDRFGVSWMVYVAPAA